MRRLNPPEESVAAVIADASREQLLRDAVAPNLVELVEGDKGLALSLGGNLRVGQKRRQDPTVVELDDKLLKSQLLQHIADGCADFRLDDRRCRAQSVDVALVELAEPSARRTIGTPHGLNLIAFPELRQLVLVLR